MTKKLTRALKGENIYPPPIWLMRQAGRYLPEYMRVRKSAGDFLSLCYTPELSSEVTLQPVRRFGLDAAIIFSDILVIPDALGQCVTFAEGKGPLLSPIRGPNQVERLDQDGVDERLAPVYQAIQRVRRDLSPDIDLIGFAGAPWTVATYMVEGGVSRDFSSVKGWAFSAPNEFQRLIDILVDVTASHLISQVSAGADALQIFDTWAGALPEPEFIRWCIEPVKEIVSLVRNKHPEIPIIGFPRGVGVGYKIYGLETGVSALSIDSSVPLSWAAKELQPNCVVQGNLDPVMLMAGGSAMVEAARNVVSTLGEKGFVFNLGHGIIRTTPPDHVAALVDAVRTP